MAGEFFDWLKGFTQKITNQGLVAAVVSLIGLLYFLFDHGQQLSTNNKPAFYLLCTAVFVVPAGIYWLHVLERERRQRHQSTRSQERVSQLESEKAELESRILAPPIRVINKQQYGGILKEWNDQGKGKVLLYNIELQSFEDANAIHRTWGELATLDNITEVVLLLPPHKVRRWEKVVNREEKNFFAEPKNRKFRVCELNPSNGDPDPKGSMTVGFALYQLERGELLDRAVLFILAQPFSEQRSPFIPGDADWWDYHHILEFSRDAVITDSAKMIWSQGYNETRAYDVDSVLRRTRPLRPVPPETLFNELRVSPSRREELLSHLAPRSLAARNPQVIPLKVAHGPFTLAYNNGDTIQGHYDGIDIEKKEPKRALVWIGGFTEKWDTRLRDIFERILRKESVVQFFFQVSPPIEFVTLARYQEDLEEVLRYVHAQNNAVVPNEIVLIARSINGLLGALVGAKDEFLDMLAGVILVAPVFDVVQMMDNYRKQRGQPHVTVEKCWRMEQGYSASEWENPQRRWLEFFEHDTSLALLADIIRRDPRHYSMEAFKDAVGAISQQRKVFILSNPDDPITGSQEALERLRNAASGTGLIRSANYRHVPIPSRHEVPGEVRRDKYPWVRDEADKVVDALREILQEVGVPVLDQQAPPGTAVGADRH